MMVPFLVASAIVPSLLLIWFFHARDVYPEPQRVVWATFALGVLTILPAGAIELVENAGLKHIADPFVGGTLDGFLCAGLTEELFKYAVVVLYCMRHKEFDEPMDGIVYGSIASLGFATLENFFYVVQGGEGIAIFRAFTAVPGHAFMGAIMGYFVGQAKFTPAQRGSLMAKALFIPILLHGAYDAPLLTFQRINAEKFHTHHQVAAAGLFAIVTLGVLVFEMTWTLRLTSRLRQQQMDWSRRRWAAYYARQPQPPPPWQVGVTTLEGTLLSRDAAAPVVHPSSGQAARGGALGWAMMAFGGLMASGGGLMLFGVILLILDPSKRPPDGNVATLAIVGALFGLVPAAVGLLLFGLGVRRVARASAVAHPPAAPVAAYGQPA